MSRNSRTISDTFETSIDPGIRQTLDVLKAESVEGLATGNPAPGSRLAMALLSRQGEPVIPDVGSPGCTGVRVRALWVKDDWGMIDLMGYGPV